MRSLLFTGGRGPARSALVLAAVAAGVVAVRRLRAAHPPSPPAPRRSVENAAGEPQPPGAAPDEGPRRLPVLVNDGAGGPVVGLVHGLGERPESWDRLLRLLDHHDVRAYAIGLPQPSDLDPRRPALAQMGDHLRAAVDEYGIEVLVGHSIGATLALRCAADVAAIEAVVASAPPGTPARLRFCLGPVLESVASRCPTAIRAALHRLVMWRFWSAVAGPRVADRIAASAGPEDARTLLRLGGELRRAVDLRRVGAMTTIVLGDSDPLVPWRRVARSALAARPNICVRVLAARHGVNRRPEFDAIALDRILATRRGAPWRAPSASPAPRPEGACL